MAETGIAAAATINTHDTITTRAKTHERAARPPTNRRSARDKGQDPWTSRAAVDERPNRTGPSHDAACATPAKIPTISDHAQMARSYPRHE